MDGVNSYGPGKFKVTSATWSRPIEQPWPSDCGIYSSQSPWLLQLKWKIRLPPFHPLVYCLFPSLNWHCFVSCFFRMFGQTHIILLDIVGVCVFKYSTHILLASMNCILSDPPFCCLKHVNSIPLQSFPLISKTPQKPWSSRWFGHTWHVIKEWFILADGRMEFFPMNYPYHIPMISRLVKSKDYPPS